MKTQGRDRRGQEARDRRERGGLTALLTLWSGEPFYRWKGSSMSVCCSVLHGSARNTRGSPITHNAPGQGPYVLVSTLAPDSEQDTSRRLSGYHGASFTFLLTIRARLWYARLENGGCPTSVEVGAGANMPTFHLLFWLFNSTTMVGTAV